MIKYTRKEESGVILKFSEYSPLITQLLVPKLNNNAMCLLNPLFTVLEYVYR